MWNSPETPQTKEFWHGKKTKKKKRGELQFLNKLWIKVTKGKIMFK